MICAACALALGCCEGFAGDGSAGRLAPPDWTMAGFDDSGWAAVKVYGDLFTAPWTSVADMTQMELYGERIRRAARFIARPASEKRPRR